MRTRIILIPLIMTGFILIYTKPAQSFSQQPGSLRGIVTDDHGKPLWGVKVKVERKGGLFATTVETDKYGRYEVPDLEAGKYEVSVISADGLTLLVDKYTIRIEPFLPTVQDFTGGFSQGPIAPIPPPDQIPPTGPSPSPTPDSRPRYEVREEKVQNEITLNDWLRELEKQGKRFVPAVFPKAQGQCLVVLEQLGSRQPIHHYVTNANRSDIRKQLERKYNAIPVRIIVGTCEAEDGSYLIILRDGKK